MIRVGFVLTFDAAGWLGGISYFRNLLGALDSLPSPRLQPVILTGLNTDSKVLEQFPPFSVVRSSILDSERFLWVARRWTSKILRRDLLLQRLLERNSIDVLSHQGFFGGLGPLPILGWIPDFQERHLPEFFALTELRARDRKIELFSSVCARVLLSSDDARKDFLSIKPAAASRARVLHFVADVVAPPADEIERVTSRYGIMEPYFYLPNQFWAHKNHGVVIDALGILKTRGVSVHVIATGNTTDRRQPGYFEDLMARTRQMGIDGKFLALGTLPYRDIVALMAGAVAVINPSRFEGWSTTVEEAKSLGKAVLLSDLAVHREQAPERGRYFSPDDPEGLAQLIHETLTSVDPSVERQILDQAQSSLPERRRAFATAYEDIVIQAVA